MDQKWRLVLQNSLMQVVSRSLNSQCTPEECLCTGYHCNCNHVLSLLFTEIILADKAGKVQISTPFYAQRVNSAQFLTA